PMCLPDGAACNPNFPCCTGPCNTQGTCGPNVCEVDGSPCIKPSQCCSLACTNGVCGGPPMCPHNECVQGAKLSPSCDPCVGKICMMDAFCCNTTWDNLCVTHVGPTCGETCGMCKPDGAGCTAPTDCCSLVCNGGICGQPMCEPQGAACGPG